MASNLDNDWDDEMEYELFDGLDYTFTISDENNQQIYESETDSEDGLNGVELKADLAAELSKAALDYYMDNNPGECYEFVSVVRGLWYIFSRGTTNCIEFLAKNVKADDCSPPKLFFATVLRFLDPEDNINLQSFEPVNDTPDESCKHDLKIDDINDEEIPIEKLTTYDELAIHALINKGLDMYNEKHPDEEEYYMFESLLRVVARKLEHRSEYSLLFNAKNVRANKAKRPKPLLPFGL